MSKPKVSVIMATYNSGKYIEESILSILNQTLKDLELIIIDDCSTDNAPEIVEKYSKSDERVVIIRNNINSGIAISRNNGIRLAKTDYVAIMDSDDMAYSQKLQIQYDFLRSHPKIAAVSSGTEIIDENGKYLKSRIGLIDPDEIKFRILLRNPFINSSVLFRKNLFEEMGGYNREFEYSEDYSLYSFLSEKYALASIPETLTKYRQNAESSVTLGSKSRKIQIENSLKINSRNINRYMTLTPENVKILVGAVNQWSVSLRGIFKSLNIYRNLLKLYINTEKLNGKQKKKIIKIYKDDLKRILSGYIKNKAPKIHSLLKRTKQLYSVRRG